MLSQKTLIKVIIYFVAFLGIQSNLYANFLFESFEGSNPIVNPAGTSDDKKYLWNQYPHDLQPSTDGWVNFTNSDVVDGERSLSLSAEAGQMYVQFYTHDGSEWDFFHEVMNDKYGIDWQKDKYNRIEFYVFVDKNIKTVDLGSKNFSIGTYVRRINGLRTNAEDGGHHFYHRYRIPYTGYWHKIVWDMHPHHDRGASGDLEHGNQAYPTEESGHNYFDALTRFYVAADIATGYTGPSEWKLDGFRVYKEPYEENEEQVYSVSGVYVANQDKLIVTWNRNKDENDIDHEVRYSFSNIHELGWNNATSTGGAFDTKGYRGYNNVHWEKTGIDMSGHSDIYVAIKPVNSDLFKQIKIPVAFPVVTGMARPGPPSNVSISIN